MKNKNSKIIVVTVLLLFLLGSFANAETQDKKTILNQVFKYENNGLKNIFSQSFLDKVSLNQIQNIINKYENKLGALNEVKEKEEVYKLIFENGTAPARISLDSNNKINGLWLGNWTIKTDTKQKIMKELNNLESDFSICIRKNEKTILAKEENKKMAVGSSFKLYVLKKLKEKIKEEQWEQILRINEQNKSIPSGLLQNWPADTPLTINTLTNLMISISDNTATDHLIEYIGRDYLEEDTNSKNIPFLKTNELFKIKHMVDSQTKRKFINGNLKTKEDILKKIKKIDLKASAIKNKPTNIKELEWFFSTQRLCEIIYDLRNSESIYINSGLASKRNWYRAGYKGGSEAGVLQYTHLLQKEKGSDIYTISLTVNNSDRNIQQSKIQEILSRFISLIKKEKI